MGNRLLILWDIFSETSPVFYINPYKFTEGASDCSKIQAKNSVGPFKFYPSTDRLYEDGSQRESGDRCHEEWKWQHTAPLLMRASADTVSSLYAGMKDRCELTTHTHTHTHTHTWTHMHVCTRMHTHTGSVGSDSHVSVIRKIFSLTAKNFP